MPNGDYVDPVLEAVILSLKLTLASFNDNEDATSVKARLTVILAELQGSLVTPVAAPHA